MLEMEDEAGAGVVLRGHRVSRAEPCPGGYLSTQVCCCTGKVGGDIE